MRWYHDLTGDTAFVQEMWPTLVAQMQWFLDRITARGLLNAREYTSFDNPLAYITCEGANINAFFYQSLRDAAYLAGVANQTTQANAYTAAADALHSAYNAQLWNATEQAYSAGYLNGSKLGPTVHAQLMALYSGLVPADRLAATRAWFLANYKNPGSGIVVGPKSNYLTWIANKAGLDMPIMYYWAFNELYRADTAAMDQEAISEMRRRWTNMVNFLQDAGTLSESFVNDQGGGMSESCHNYGAIPAYFLSSFVLGPRVTGPHGNRQLVIEPRPGDLTSASGTVVTDLGPVPVSWTKNNGTLQFSCTVPAGKTATLRLPVAGSTITLDGNVMNNPLIEGRHVVLPLSAGAHAVTAEAPPTTTPDDLRGHPHRQQCPPERNVSHHFQQLCRRHRLRRMDRSRHHVADRQWNHLPGQCRRLPAGLDPAGLYLPSSGHPFRRLDLDGHRFFGFLRQRTMAHHG